METQFKFDEKTMVFAADDDNDYLNLFAISCGSLGLNNYILSENAAKFSKNLNDNLSTISKAIFFVDIRMEDDDSGFRILESIKKHKYLSIFPVIIMSSSMLMEDINRSYKLGANCFLYKPVGSRNRVETLKDQLTFWLTSIPQPELYRFSNDADYIEHKNNTKSPYYSMDLLRRDILVAFIKDLEKMSNIRIDQSTKKIVGNAMVRFIELFKFRMFYFGPDLINLIGDFSSLVDQWVSAGDIINRNDDLSVIDALENRRRIMVKIKRSRVEVSDFLREFESKVPNQPDTKFQHIAESANIPFLVWDIFFDLSQNAKFRELFRAVNRLQRKAF